VRLAEHFKKHGAEFEGFTEADYLRAAQVLRDRPVGGEVLELTRPDQTISRFDRATGAFVAFLRDGTVQTFFKPGDGEAYFRRQARRRPE
jgi:pyocin large subunit-like protein